VYIDTICRHWLRTGDDAFLKDFYPSARAALAVNAEGRARVFPISAVTGEGVDSLLAAISKVFDEEKSERVLDLGYAEGRKRAWLHEEGVVQEESETEGGHRVTVRWTARQEKRFREF
jgi:GTP-binding protein HflX